MVLLNASTRSRNVGSLINANQGGGNKKAGLAPQIGKDSWTSMFFKFRAINTLVTKSLTETTENPETPDMPTILSGYCIDGYVKHAKGLLQDSTGNIIETFSSDESGYFVLNTKSDQLPEYFKIEFTDGTDLTTNLEIKNTFSAVLSKNMAQTGIVISPITTLIAKTMDSSEWTENNISISEEIVTTAFGLGLDSIYNDFIESNDKNIAKIITQIEILSNTISASSDITQNQVYSSLANVMKEHVNQKQSMFSLDASDNIELVFQQIDNDIKIKIDTKLKDYIQKINQTISGLTGSFVDTFSNANKLKKATKYDISGRSSSELSQDIDELFNSYSSARLGPISKNQIGRQQEFHLTLDDSYIYGNSILLSAAGGREGTVRYTASQGNINGNYLENPSVGEYTITAIKDVGTYDITATKTITITKADQDSFVISNDSTYSYVPNASITLTRTGGTGNGKVTYTTSQGTIKNDQFSYTSVGSYTIVATKSGGTNYNSVTATKTITITQAEQNALVFSNASTYPYAPNESITLNTDGGSGDGEVTYTTQTIGGTIDGDQFSYTSVGSYTIVATKLGGTNYNDFLTTITIDIETSSNTPNHFNGILKNTLDINLNMKVLDSTQFQRVLFGNDSDILTINDHSLTLLENKMPMTYNEILSSTFTLYLTVISGSIGFRVESQLHSNYALDMDNYQLVLSDIHSSDRKNHCLWFAIRDEHLVVLDTISYENNQWQRNYIFQEDHFVKISDTTVVSEYIELKTYESILNFDKSNEWTDAVYISNATAIPSDPSFLNYDKSIVNSPYADQLTDITAVDEILDQIISDLQSKNETLRYDKTIYKAFRESMLSRRVMCDNLYNAGVGVSCVNAVYFTNEKDGENFHPFMVVASNLISESPLRLMDVPTPPGDGTSGNSYAEQNVTRYAKAQLHISKIPLKDYGLVTNYTDNFYDATLLSYFDLPGVTKPASDVFNYASVGEIGIAIDGVKIYPSMNNRLVFAQNDGEVAAGGIHVGQGFDLHYHADGHAATRSGLNLYNITDYSHMHPPLIGFGLDGIALYGRYENNFNNMWGFLIELDPFGGHDHDGIGYHYHCHTDIVGSKHIHILMKGAWKGRIGDIPSFWDDNDRQPRVYTTNEDAATDKWICGTNSTVDFNITSDDFNNEEEYPIKFQCIDVIKNDVAGEGLSPSLKWVGAPVGTVSFALLMYHYPVGTTGGQNPSTYWMLWDIPSTTSYLDAGNMSNIGKKGPDKDTCTCNEDATNAVCLQDNFTRKTGYTPPCSHTLNETHNYSITIYALKAELNTVDLSFQADNTDITYTQYMRAINSLSLGQATIRTYTNTTQISSGGTNPPPPPPPPPDVQI